MLTCDGLHASFCYCRYILCSWAPEMMSWSESANRARGCAAFNASDDGFFPADVRGRRVGVWSREDSMFGSY